MLQTNCKELRIIVSTIMTVVRKMQLKGMW